MFKKVLCVFCLVVTNSAFAADLPKDVQRCSAVSDSVKRLACFDGIAAFLQKKADDDAKKDLSEKNPEKTAWNADISKSKVDDSVEVNLFATTNDTVSGRFNRTARPTLVLRCLENQTAAYINFDGLFMADIQGYGRVTFRVDKKKAFSRNMDVSTDSKALGFWSGGSAIPFIKSLYGGKSLLIRATPFNESPVTFSVNIAGTENAVKPLRKACRW